MSFSIIISTIYPVLFFGTVAFIIYVFICGIKHLGVGWELKKELEKAKIINGMNEYSNYIRMRTPYQFFTKDFSALYDNSDTPIIKELKNRTVETTKRFQKHFLISVILISLNILIIEQC